MNSTIFDLKEFLRIVRNKPSAIRNLSANAPHEVIAEALYTNYRCQEFMTPEQMNTKVLGHFVKLITENLTNYWRRTINRFPLYARNHVDRKIVEAFIEKNSDALTMFGDLSYEVWLKHIKKYPYHIEFNSIPSEYITEEFLKEALQNSNCYFHRQIPESVWTEELARIAVQASSYGINSIPEHLQTLDLYKLAFNVYPDLQLNPLKVCDKGLAELATADGNNLELIPDKFINRDMVLRCLPNCSYKNIPARYRDEDMAVEYFCKSCVNHGDFEEFYGESLIMKIAKRDHERKNCVGLDSYNETIGIDKNLWPQIIAVNPRSLEFIPKPEQTDEIITTFIHNAVPSEIDEAVEIINLGKIKKKHAPFLIGVEKPVLTEIVERKLGKKVVPSTIVTENQVILKMTEAEYLKLCRYADNLI